VAPQRLRELAGSAGPVERTCRFLSLGSDEVG
jgi:hypothetical protein